MIFKLNCQSLFWFGIFGLSGHYFELPLVLFLLVGKRLCICGWFIHISIKIGDITSSSFVTKEFGNL